MQAGRERSDHPIRDFCEAIERGDYPPGFDCRQFVGEVTDGWTYTAARAEFDNGLISLVRDGVLPAMPSTVRKEFDALLRTLDGIDAVAAFIVVSGYGGPSWRNHYRTKRPRRALSEVEALAHKLAPHSAAIAAVLVMLERNRGRIDRARNPVDHLPQLVEEVMARLGVNADGEFVALSVGDASEPQTIDAALQWMERRHYCHTTTHWNQIWQAERKGVYLPLLKWLDTVTESFAKGFGIPVCAETLMVSKLDHYRRWKDDASQPFYGDCPSHHGFGVELVHAIRGTALPAKCWDVFTDMGFEFAADFGLVLDHYSSRPEFWAVMNWAELKDQAEAVDYIDPDVPLNFSRSPPGEREMLLRHYGLEP